MNKKNKRLAAIDIGSNSIRCIVVEVLEESTFRVLTDEKATVRLGENMTSCGRIAAVPWQRAMESLLRMKKIADGYGAELVEAVATSAVRRAVNGGDFVRAVERETGIRAEVISGEEEARLVSLSVLNNFDMEGVRYGMVDIGGGSLEIVTAFGGHVEEFYSLELGAVTITDRFLRRDPVVPEDLARLYKHVRASLKAAFKGEQVKAQVLVASGGTITSIASMIMAMRREKYDTAHGYEALLSDIVHLLAMLQRKDLKGRGTLPGLNPDRADIIVAGVAVISEVMRFFDVNILRVNERGIREGLILDILRKHELVRQKGHRRTWREAVLDFARSCLVDEEHAGHVARLALEMFDVLSGPFALGDKERRILEAASLLHDAGYFISYTSHHKHSYHLIRHADLLGFTPREREIIANTARYHRKSLPGKKHDSFARLTEEDCLLVCRLGGILRLADGLDRRRGGVVRRVNPTLTRTVFRLRLESDEDLSVELFSGRQKGVLLEEAFQRKLVMEEEKGNPSVQEK